MSKAGGIAYLLKHGRAPFPVTTRTQQPRAKGVKRMDDGGLTYANAPLNYGTVPDYVFVPGGMTIDERTGKPVWKSGRYELRSPSAAGAGAAAGATGSVGVPGVVPGYDGGRGGREGFGGQTDYGAVIGDSSASGKTWGELSPSQQAAYSAAADPYGIGKAIAGVVSNSLLGRAATAVGGWLDSVLGRSPGGVDGSGWGGGVPGGSIGGPGVSMGTAAGNAGVNDAETAGQDATGAPDTSSSVGDFSGDVGGRDTGASTDGGYGGGNTGGGYSGAGADRDAVGGWYKNGKFNQPAYAAGGIAALAGGGQPQGPRLLSGGGDGLSDGIPAVIGKGQPARLADGEFVVSADVVSALGGGSTKAGAKKLYDMMDRIRQNAHGTKKQVKKVNERKVLPA